MNEPNDTPFEPVVSLGYIDGEVAITVQDGYGIADALFLKLWEMWEEAQSGDDVEKEA